MANYKLVFKKSVVKDFHSIVEKAVRRILQRVEALQEDPRPAGSEKLSGQERYRVRPGSYRIVYEIADEHLVVTVVKVGHRRHVNRAR